MHLSKTMITNPAKYRTDSNGKLIDLAVDTYNKYQDNRWWPAGDSTQGITIFTDNHILTVKRDGICVDKLVDEPSYRYTEIDGVTFIEADGWWIQSKLFIGLESDNGELKGDPNHMNMPATVKALPWLKDCCFRMRSGYLEFWYPEADYPGKSTASRSIREVSMRNLFKEKYNVIVEALNDKDVSSQYGDVMRYLM